MTRLLLAAALAVGCSDPPAPAPSPVRTDCQKDWIAGCMQHQENYQQTCDYKLQQLLNIGWTCTPIPPGGK